MSEINFAVIGTGSMAASMMSTFARAGVRVVAVVSHELERGRRFASAFGIPTASEDLSPLLRNSEIDAVYIANSTAEHATTAIAALEAGKAVLCEKPLARSIEEAERVAEAAGRTGQLCMEGIWTLFLPAYRRFLELARDKICGEPTHLFADFGYPVREDVLPRLFAPTTGGVLLDRGVYLVALAIKVFGPVQISDVRLRFTADRANNHASMLLGHLDGGQSQLSTSFSSYMSNSATLACSRGVIRLENPLIGAETVSTQLISAERNAPQDPTLPLGPRQKVQRLLRQRALLRRLKRILPNNHREFLTYGADQYLPQLDHFLALRKAGARGSDIVPLELSLAILRVIGQTPADHRR